MQRLSLSYTWASKLGLCPSVGSAHILFKCQRIPLFVPTMLNTNSLQLYHIYSEVKLPCTSLQRHPLRRILRPGGVHSQTWDRRADPALRTCWRTKQQQQGWHQAASSTAGHTATSSSTAQTANHPVTPRNFFSFYLPPPPAEFRSQPLQPNSLAPLTSPYGKLIAQNSLTGTCF